MTDEDITEAINLIRARLDAVFPHLQKQTVKKERPPRRGWRTICDYVFGTPHAGRREHAGKP